MFSNKFKKLLGAPRQPESELTERHHDIAATLQAVLENILIKSVRYLTKTNSTRNLCMAGGIALNCVANGKILEHTDVKNLFVQPASGDDGGALGAALFVYHQVLNNNDRKPLKNYYLGPEFSGIYVNSMLKKQNENIIWEELDDQTVLTNTANALNSNKVVGWFQGRMEFGPRALGNRSILATSKDPNMKDVLNHKIKKREGFRPFAPAVLKEYSNQYFDIKQDSPYMLVASALKEDKLNEVPAINHIDNTARIQTVGPEDNLKFYNLLKQFNKISDTPVLLNTSFNLRGEAIVCTPEDALKCFINSELDILIINNFWIEKEKS